MKCPKATYVQYVNIHSTLTTKMTQNAETDRNDLENMFFLYLAVFMSNQLLTFSVTLNIL